MMLSSISCSDENDEIINRADSPIEVSELEVTMPILGRYYSLTASIKDERQLALSSDSDWLILNSDSVASDGSFEFYVADNRGELGRDGIITVYLKDEPTISTSVKVHQKGPNEFDSNEGETLYDRFRMGYGYNIFKNYMDDNSKTLPILNTANPVVEQMIQMALSSKEEVEHVSSNTLEEMAQMLTKRESTSSSSILGNKNTSSRFEQNGTISRDESWYSYIRLYRTCATAAIDMGIFNQQFDKLGGELFTDNFREVYDKIVKDRHEPSPKEIDDLLNRFGTHLVVMSELGGSMDVTLNFRRTMAGSLNMRAEDFSDFFFKGENMEYDRSDICTNIKSNDNGTSAFKIVGGSKSSRDAINRSINGSEKRIKPADLLAWQNSISLSSIKDIMRKDGVIPINFQMVPISFLFPSYMHKHILDGMLRMSERSSNNALNDLKVGTDKYVIRLKGADFMNFRNSDNASLVKVLYVSNQSSGELIPTLEICNEYVPVIRGDRRINVVYAIRNGRVFHGAGLFPGDSEGNPPAWLTFSDGKVYVDPIKNIPASGVVEQIYYMHGNIYETDLGLNPPVPKRMVAEEHNCVIEYSEDGQPKVEKIPCVKIGSGYWFRSNSTVDLSIVMHSDDDSDDGDIYEYSIMNSKTGKYYAGLYGDMNSEFMGMNKDYVGKQKWFLPTPTDVSNLRRFMSNNTKGFFKGQVSGFNAEFDGYYGQFDVRNDKQYEYMEFRDLGKVCCIGCRTDWNSNGEAKGAVMLLWPDYSIGQASELFCSSNYFPVRLYRGSGFQYQNK